MALVGLLGAGVAVGAGLSIRAWGRDHAGEPEPVGEHPLISNINVLTSDLALPQPFKLPLVVPPVLTPVPSGGADTYELVQQVAKQEILPGLQTEIWGYNGVFPGPTLVSRRGRPTVVRHRNELPVPTVVHLHGGHTPPGSDGFPTDLVLPDPTRVPKNPRASVKPMPPGMTHHAPVADPAAHVVKLSRDYTYPMDQRAATLWYHDHRMDYTGPSVWRGLAGFHLVRDDVEDALPLPGGDREIPLMIADRAFAADGSLKYPSLDPSLTVMPGVEQAYMQGVMGDVILVNGVPWPVLEVEAVRYRFRILNASNARSYELALDRAPDGDVPLVQIGSDGGLLGEPVAHRTLSVAPAQRFDVVIDFSRYRPGDLVKLTNLAGTGPTVNVMAFRVTRTASDDSSVPAKLSDFERIDPAEAVRERSFDFHRAGDEGWFINGRFFDPTKPEATPKLGDTELWTFTSDYHHPVHVHLVSFQVVSRDGGPPGRYDVGWKDTVFVNGAEKVSVIARFTGYRGRYVLHCHNLEHEDMAMMSTFEVV
ncbi:multicopper oxidase domain-containing protein [Catellatospora sp. NEAU-YM18]|nr:multicopper oxidase domain-containing protein [Catellatospora tritici]